MRELEPDIVVLTGDMVTGNDKDFTVFFNLVEQISQEYPIYYIPGNHEVALKDSSKQEFLNLFERTGVVFLNNQKVELESDCGDIINLYGLWYQNLHYVKEPLNIEMIEQYIGVANTSVYNILLTHQPKYFELYEKWGADLIMSGHIHGGMVRLPYFGPVFSPDEGLFPQYAAGEYYLNDSVLVVSRGLGIGTRGFRVFNRPDLVLITLKSA
jgi:predicted MPP superfamily phosphohydrolase